MYRRRLLALTIAWTAGWVTRLEAAADNADRLSIYRVNYTGNSTIGGVAGLGAALPVIYEDKIIHKQCPCDRGNVNRVDRPVIDYHSAAARTAGDITVSVALAAPAFLDGLDVGFKNKTYLEDMMV